MSTAPELITLRSIERRLEHTLQDIRQLQKDIQSAHQDKGVLGSRGLTQFCVDLLKSNTKPAWSVEEMLIAAERAGYAIPTRRTLSKRLTGWQYRRGGVRWVAGLDGWTWSQETEVKL